MAKGQATWAKNQAAKASKQTVANVVGSGPAEHCVELRSQAAQVRPKSR